MTDGGGVATVLRRVMDLLFRTERGRAGRELGTTLQPRQCSDRKIQRCEGRFVGYGCPSGANSRRILSPSNVSQ